MFMGALLLLAAIITWGTVLMLSPHGDSVVQGTQHIRTTIVTFKRNAAVGTLILSALAAWLLFPRRPRWPARDWALIALLTFLVGTSAYTLISLRPATVPLNADENFAGEDMNVDWNSSGAGSEMVDMNAPQTDSIQFEVDRANADVASKAKDRAKPDHEIQAAQNGVSDEQPADVGMVRDEGNEGASNESDGNEE